MDKDSKDMWQLLYDRNCGYLVFYFRNAKHSYGYMHWSGVGKIWCFL